mgnify:FL=1
MAQRPPPASFTGVLRGLDTALGGWLARFASRANQCRLSDECMVVFPVDHWADHAWSVNDVTGTIAIGSSTLVTIYTVPRDRRFHLEFIFVQRASGDNTAQTLTANQPAGYGPGAAWVDPLAELTVGAASMQWPAYSGTYNYNRVAGALPVLLEPGATITLGPGGAGIATSTFNIYISGRLTPLVRARAP